MKIELKAIGSVVSPVKEPVDENWGEVVSEIVLEKKYADGLIGLEDFSHAVITYFMHLATDKNKVKITRRPQGRDDMPFVGIFSQRAKRRPNSVGVTAVKIINVEIMSSKFRALMQLTEHLSWI